MTTTATLLGALQLGPSQFALGLQNAGVAADLAVSEDVVTGVESLVKQLEPELGPDQVLRCHDDFVNLRRLVDGGQKQEARGMLAGVAARLATANIPAEKYSQAVRQIQIPEEVDLETLADFYLRKKDLEESQIQEQKEKFLAVFEAGSLLTILKPIEVYDPTDRHFVKVPAGARLIIAQHEGNVLLGELSDHSHCVGVIYEEESHWYQRKYFLPVATLLDESAIRIEKEEKAAFDEGRVKGLQASGEAAETVVAIRSLEDLKVKDEISFIPRGSELILPKGCKAFDPDSKKSVKLKGGTRAEVLNAVGDITEGTMEDGIWIRVEGKKYLLSYEILLALDPLKNVLTPEDLERERAAAVSRREALRRTWGLGLGVAAVAVNAGLLFGIRTREEVEAETPPQSFGYGYPPAQETEWTEERRNHALLASLTTEASTLYGYFTAKDHYWWSLHGILMNLRKNGAKKVLEALLPVVEAIEKQASEFYDAYEEAFYNTVHVGWTEIKHYSTDSKGNRHYTHSTWIKNYAMVWTEPDGLEGKHKIFYRWMVQAHRLAARTRYMLRNGLFDLLAADPADPEASFSMQRRSLGVGRDAAIAAITMGLMAGPAGFYDEIVAFMQGSRSGPRATKVSPGRGYIQFQKESLLAAGMALGVGLSISSSTKLQRVMEKNKYDLGDTVEKEMKRVPTLDFDAAWEELYELPVPEKLAANLRERRETLTELAPYVRDFTYIHGIGFDNGRVLDPYFVNADPVRRIIGDHAEQWPVLAEPLQDWAATPTYKERALPVMQNAIGTRILEAQMAKDKEEASWGSFNRSMAFGLPLWGAVLADLLLKWNRKGMGELTSLD